MNKDKIGKIILKKILYLAILLIQLSLIIAVFIINDLTSKRAGVMRHIYTRRLEYEQGVLSHSNLMNHNFLMILLGILFVFLLIYTIKKRRKLFIKIQITLGLIMSTLVLFTINSKMFIDMMAYPYFIIAFEIILIIQTLIVFLLHLGKGDI